MKSHSKVLGVRTSTYKYWGDTVQPITGPIPGDWFKWSRMELRLWCGKLHFNACPGMPIAVGSKLQVTGVKAGDEVGRVLLVQALSLALHCPHQWMAMGNVTQSHWVSVVLSVKSGQSHFACLQAGGWTRYFLKFSSSFKIFYSGGNYKANSWWWWGLKKTRRESIWTGFDYHCSPYRHHYQPL